MSDPASLSLLTDDELRELRAAATWYANYHTRAIVEEAEDRSAYAVEERRRYLTLLAALNKLGVRKAIPDELADRKPLAA